MANLHEKLIDIKRMIGDLDVALEDLRLTVIKDELDKKKDNRNKHDLYNSWYDHYIDQGHTVKDAMKYASEHLREALEQQFRM